MIVKDEENTITDTLASVAQHLDYYTILDTGIHVRSSLVYTLFPALTALKWRTVNFLALIPSKDQLIKQWR